MPINSSPIQSILQLQGIQQENAGVEAPSLPVQSSEQFLSMMMQQMLPEKVEGDSQVIEIDAVSVSEAELPVLLEGEAPIEFTAPWSDQLQARFADWVVQEDAGDIAAELQNVEMVESDELSAMFLPFAPAGQELPLERQYGSTDSDSLLTGKPLLNALDADAKTGMKIPLIQAIDEAEIALPDESEMEGDDFLKVLATEDKPKFEEALVQREVRKMSPADTVVSRGNETTQPTSIISQATPALNSAQPDRMSAEQLQVLAQPLKAGGQQFGEAIGERVAFLINHKLNSAEIRVDPPHLGKLDIQIQVKDDNSAVVVIQTQSAQTRDLVDSASLRLREFLQDAGYAAVDVNVSHQQSSGQQEMAQQSENSAGVSETDESGHQPESAHLMQSAHMWVDDGRIDFFA